MANLSIVFEALKTLISVPESTSSSPRSLTERLNYNLSSYKNLLKNPAFNFLGKLEYQRIMWPPVDSIELDSLVLYSKFCCEAVSLIALLDDLLNECEITTIPAKAKVPHPQANLLSVADEKVLKSVLEFVICLGLYPYLLPGADAVLKLRLKRAESVVKAGEVNQSFRDCCLYRVCAVLIGCFSNPVIGAAMATRHLVDVLAALIQVLYVPDHCTESKEKLESSDLISKAGQNQEVITFASLSSPGDVAQRLPSMNNESVRNKCLVLLNQVLNKTYQPLVVQQLLLLQGPPSTATKKQGTPSKRPLWLVKACGQLLSERLMTKNGVSHIITGIMESTSGQTLPQAVMWCKCKAVAGVLATPPSTVSSLEHYYTIVCPQIINLLRDQTKNEECLRIATESLSLMLKKNKKLGDIYLLQPFLQPFENLLNCCSVPTTQLIKDIQDCIHLLHKISEVSEPSSVFWTCLLPYSTVLFKLWQLVPLQDKMSTYCKEILGLVLASHSNTDVLHFLCSVCGLPQMSFIFKNLDCSISISYSGQPPQLSISRSTELSELDVMESSCNLVIDLLQTTLHSRALVGQFFGKCIQFLASVLSKDVKLDDITQKELSSDSSSVLLECEQALPKSKTEVLNDAGILYITAALIENLIEVVLQDVNIPTLLESCRTVLECHAKAMSKTKGVQLIPREPVGVDITGGPVSLSMCCGLISAMMSTSKTVGKLDKLLLTSLRHPLDEIAAGYPDTELRGLAGDISICIATLGAVWSAEAESHAMDFKAGGKKMVKQVKADVQQTLEQVGKDEHVEEAAAGVQSVKDTCEDVVSSSPYHNALKDSRDSVVPVRGHGLIALTRLMYAKDKETLSNTSSLLDQFQRNLGHSDSYVYLAAINALVALALSTPQTCSEKVLTTLCQEYANLSCRPDRTAGLLYDKDTGQRRKPVVLNVTPNHGIEVRVKLGETLVKIFQKLSEMLPHYLDDIVASLLTTVKDNEPLLRASSFSNIAELCSLNREMVDHLLTEVLSCVSHVLKSDKEPPVRQAALMVLKNIIRGSSITTIPERSGELREIYHLLKQTESTEHDELTRAHAQAALGELDTKMRSFIFSSERKLEKKITILP